MASTALRKVVSYSDLDMAAAASGSTSSLAPSASSLAASSASGKRPNWDSSGQALTASASRKLRKLLSLARGGNVEQVESMLKNDASVVGARVNEELKEAMREARRAMRGEDEDEEDEDEEQDEEEEEEEEEGEEGDEEEDRENDDFDEVNGGHGEVDEEMDEGGAIDSFDWQGINGGSENGSGRALTHREIWDDDALKNAWDAAVEEYEIFHRRRQEAHEQQQEVSQKKRKRESALWYDSPAPGSKAALEAKTKQADEARELARRKQEAKKLVRDLAANEATPPSSKSNLSVPPSRHLASNSSAWKRACAMVAQTPNRIGPSHTSAVPSAAPSMATATRLADPAATFASADSQAAAAPSTAPPSAMSKEDTLQNLAMAWYYAGYYQAQAQALVASLSPQQQGE